MATDLYYVQPDGKWKKNADGRSKGRTKEEVMEIGGKIEESKEEKYKPEKHNVVIYNRGGYNGQALWPETDSPKSISHKEAYKIVSKHEKGGLHRITQTAAHVQPLSVAHHYVSGKSLSSIKKLQQHHGIEPREEPSFEEKSRKYSYDRDLDKKLNEEVPTNNVSGGKMAGMGVGPDSEPPKKNIKMKTLKRYKEFVNESSDSFGIGDFVKLNHAAEKEHGHKYGQISGIGGYGDNKGKVRVHLKKSPHFTDDHVKHTEIHISSLKNLTDDPKQHQVEMANHTYKQKGFRNGDKVVGISRNSVHGEGIIFNHNLVNGITQVKHGENIVNHNPSDLKKVK